MKTFTPFEYLAIDIANNYGFDKWEFSSRINWVLENFNDLEKLGDAQVKWKEQPLYLKAVQTLRKAQRGEATGHMVHFDSTASGMQIMSAITGCEEGAYSTNLINPEKRMDPYTECTEIMKEYIPALESSRRNEVKDALMCAYYGSIAEPEKLFGQGTPELEAFYKAMSRLAPGACVLLEQLRDTWQPYALEHSWVLPDNHHVHVKVMDDVTARVRPDELGSSFTYKYSDNIGMASGVKNIANVIHSIDAYILRSLVRRCNYEPEVLSTLCNDITEVLLDRAMGADIDSSQHSNTLYNWALRYQDTGIADMASVDDLYEHGVGSMPTDYLVHLNQTLHSVLAHKPFEIVTVHDSFACLPSNMNQLRFHYKEIMAELSEATVLDDIFTKLLGKKITYEKLSNTLGDKIRSSNYAIC